MLAHALGTVADRLDRLLELLARNSECLGPVADLVLLAERDPLAVVAALVARVVAHQITSESWRCKSRARRRQSSARRERPFAYAVGFCIQHHGSNVSPTFDSCAFAPSSSATCHSSAPPKWRMTAVAYVVCAPAASTERARQSRTSAAAAARAAAAFSRSFSNIA